MRSRIIIMVVTVTVLMGCVSSKEHKARLSDIDNLKEDIAGLDEKLRESQDEKALLEQHLSQAEDDISNLERSLSELNEEHTTLREEHGNLETELAERNIRIKELKDDIRSKAVEILELKNDIARLSHEKSLAIDEKERAIAALKVTYNDLVTELNEEIKQGEIAVTQLRDKLSLSMVEEILFDSGSAAIKKKGKDVLERVAHILEKVDDKQIRIEGHTDNVGISARLARTFPTNWELSTARATNVVKYLEKHSDIDPSRLSAAGYSEYRPVDDNETAEGRARNRRIEIVLIPMDYDRIPVSIEE